MEVNIINKSSFLITDENNIQINKKFKFTTKCERCDNDYITCIKAEQKKQNKWICQRCVNLPKMIKLSLIHNFNINNFRIDYINFLIIDIDNNLGPVKLKINATCKLCNAIYETSVHSEKRYKKHKWHCQSCAIYLEWQCKDYKEKHINGAINMWTREDFRNKQSQRTSKPYRGVRSKYIDLSGREFTFRSKLEKRFALFLDMKGYTWFYEKNFFRLFDNRVYIPDFYIEELDLWIEIKTHGNHHDNMEKWYLFCKEYQEVRKCLIIKKEISKLEKGINCLENYIN